MSNPALEFRKKCRAAEHTTITSGFVPGYAQANLLVLPKEAADDFQNLCERNPVPCPIVGITPVGNPLELNTTACASGVDVSKDFPMYNVYENGKLIETKTDISEEWTDNHVGFLIGCSYSFENALNKAGLPPKGQLLGTNVSMYVTSKRLDPAGIFTDSTYVVSMRPYKKSDLEKVRSITSKFKKTHGEPIDWGFDGAERLGIKDISKPDFGDATPIAEDEIPVFWGCGVTPQIAAAKVGDKIKGKVLAHAPGHMIILDIKDEEVPFF